MNFTPQSITPESVRSVMFREKLRGYHPEDVDAFVAAVAQAIEDLDQRAKRAESRLAEVESRSSGAVEAEDSLRRTLVLAQRTADLAIQEAREEAARLLEDSRAQREAADRELAELRAHFQAEVEEESRGERARLVAQWRALRADVDALEWHLERERERLRIYFVDQLRRVEEGEPGIARSPEMQAEVPPEPEPSFEAPQNPNVVEDAPAELEAGSHEPEGGVDEDPFLAELRRAVNDDEPLGPRDHVSAASNGEGDDESFDLFARGDDDAGRFGSRLRRRK
ncbi:MAG TPA: DivIVA domain-containing protein [Acidimicrobiales bacterium]|nr:DivIVA domain-containing protein [Acidimicrobiales bacterium]